VLCHAAETDRLLLSGLDLNKLHTIESHMSPRVWRELHCAPKPKEVSYGVFEEDTEHYKVQDLLVAHPKPERATKQRRPSTEGTVLCLDAVSCRTAAITQRERGLPVFCPLDEPEPFDPQKDFDFVYVDMKCRIHQGLSPYTGARWYCPEVTEWLLDKGIISQGMCKAGLRASRHVPSAIISGHVDTLKAVCETMNFASEKELKAFQKQGILSMIGL